MESTNGINSTKVTTYFNGQPFHSPAISMAYTMDAILKNAMGSNDHSLTTNNFPLPLSLSAELKAANTIRMRNTGIK
jgi:hypothetical protein